MYLCGVLVLLDGRCRNRIVASTMLLEVCVLVLMLRRVQGSQGDGDAIGTQASIGSGSSTTHPTRRSFAFYRNTSKASRGTAADVSSERSGDDAPESNSRSWSLFHSLRSSRAAHRSTSSTSAAAAAAAAAVGATSAGEGGDSATDGSSAAAAAARPPPLATASEDASASSSPQSPQAAPADGGSASATRARRRQPLPRPAGSSGSNSGSPLPLQQLPADLSEVSVGSPVFPPLRLSNPAPPLLAQAGRVSQESDSLLDWNSPLPSGMSVIPEVTETLTATMEFPPTSTGRLGMTGPALSRRTVDASTVAEGPVGFSAGSVDVATTDLNSTSDIMSMAHSPLPHASPGPDDTGVFGESKASGSSSEGGGRARLRDRAPAKAAALSLSPEQRR